MYAQEKIKPYTGKAEKGKMVKSMFDTISPCLLYTSDAADE